ncbi:MAG: acyl-CoA dehydrogenase family protein, partial [Elusimicrobia bacterium]|nr:acyl-CoA dehydrogenase family protein [Elusimicrobiota bacterium]
MNFDFDAEHAELQRRAREFCQKEIAPKAQANDAKETFHWDTVPALREVINYHAYDDAWVPDMLAGSTMEAAGADKFDGDLLGDDPVGNFEA